MRHTICWPLSADIAVSGYWPVIGFNAGEGGIEPPAVADAVPAPEATAPDETGFSTAEVSAATDIAVIGGDIGTDGCGACSGVCNGVGCCEPVLTVPIPLGLSTGLPPAYTQHTPSHTIALDSGRLPSQRVRMNERLLPAPLLAAATRTVIAVRLIDLKRITPQRITSMRHRGVATAQTHTFW